MVEELLDAWRINHRVNLCLLRHISDAGLRCTLSRRGGRNVARQFAHIHYVRVFQLNRRAKPLVKGAQAFPTQHEPDRSALVAALEDSSRRIEQWIYQANQGVQGIRTFKRGLAPTVAYLVAHESHHRGSILLTLKQSGEPLEKRIRDGI